MMAAYHTGYFEQCDSGAEFLNENTYFGISYHPYETLFFKTNRPINEKVIDRYTEWTDARNYSSYDFCKAPV
jgi:tRNA/tmRNA/rRNA uracil-C5-methylase (TrmA/RlmC/RlmD family)